jgi:threonine aldolase
MAQEMELDFRSDTVTRPDRAMRQAMYDAEVGDDVYGEDNCVNQLEVSGAELLGKQAGLFVSSGTQANLISILSHAGRGDEYITGRHYHTNFYEAGGAAALGGVVPCTLPVDGAGRVCAADVREAIKPDDFHHPISKLLCLENTVNGQIQPAAHLAELCQIAHENNMFTHLDGARLMNASVASKIAAADIVKTFDSVSLCLSKGLGAPAGSLICGSADFIARARRWRKMLGGGMRQAGILAAAGRYAIEYNIQRLAEDHENARQLAEKLAQIKGVDVDVGKVDTNMIYMFLPEGKQGELPAFLRARDIIISPAKKGFRLVLHKDIPATQTDRLAKGVAAFMAA